MDLTSLSYERFTLTFILVATGILIGIALLYSFIRAVSYSTYRSLEEEWRRKYRRRESGREGEETMAHELAFLPREYRVLHRVYLYVPGRELGQEIDHLVIGPNGIFHIETKNDLGKIVITQDGDWLIKRDKKYQGMRNPLAQIRRHHLVIKEFLEEHYPDEEIPITGIVALSRPETMLEGASNSQVPVIKAERVPDFITSFRPPAGLSLTQVELIYFKLSGYVLTEDDDFI